MAWVAVAIGGSALLGAGAALYAGSKQADAANAALGFQKQVYQQNQKQVAPFIGKLDESYTNPQSFLTSPDYKFMFGQGMDALQNSAAAKGGLLSGNFAEAAQRYGQGYAANYLTNYRTNLNSTVGAITGVNNSNNAGAGAIGNTTMGVGAANASGVVGAANALTGGAQNYLLYNALGKSSYGGGGYLSGGGAAGGFGQGFTGADGIPIYGPGY